MQNLSGYLYPCIPKRPLTENPSILSAPCNFLGTSVHQRNITSFLAILTVVISISSTSRLIFHIQNSSIMFNFFLSKGRARFASNEVTTQVTAHR